MPILGEIKEGLELGYHRTAYKSKHLGLRYYDYKYVWQACADCSKERWVRLVKGKPLSSRCRSCAAKAAYEKHPMMFPGERNIHWKGGRINNGHYILIKLQPDDFFYSMTDMRGYVPEHRLVIAKHLNRCLLPWEIVHHKNSQRTDNRLENLQLFPSQIRHLPSIGTRRYINRLEKRIEVLERELQHYQKRRHPYLEALLSREEA